MLFALLFVRGAFFVVANDCPKYYMMEVRQGGLGSTSSRACGVARNFPALGLDDLTKKPTELCNHEKMLLLFEFCDVFFCQPSVRLPHHAGLCCKRTVFFSVGETVLIQLWFRSQWMY